MSGTPKRNEDSGLIDLDALMRQANESGPTLAVEESGERPIVRAPEPPPVVAAPPPPPAAPPPPRPARRGILLPLAGALALAIAVMAGALSWPRAEPVAVAVAPPPPAVVTAPPPAPSPRTVAEPSPADLPSAPPSAAVGASASVAPMPRPRPAPAASAAVVAVSDVAIDPPSASGDLGRAMHDAVGTRDEARAETTGSTASGARQLRPSPGAVVGAINAVLPAARACLGPDDPIRSGMLVFRSDGSVARVELRGERPQDECIRTAMGRARIEPFVEDTFTTRITVRP